MRNRFTQEESKRFAKSMSLMILLKLDQESSLNVFADHGQSGHGQSVRLALTNEIRENSEKLLQSMKSKTLWKNDSKM